MEADPAPWQEFTPLSQSIAATAREAPTRRAVADERKSLTWAELDALVDRIAASLQRDGAHPRSAIAICASASVEYLAVFLGALRAGIAVAPLAPSSTSASLAAMVADCDAALVFVDASTRETFETIALDRPRIALDDSSAGEAFTRWLAPGGAKPRPVEMAPDWTFNIIYSSGTTGAPKGIDPVPRHALATRQALRSVRLWPGRGHPGLYAALFEHDPGQRVPRAGGGGAIVLMKKFEAREFLRLAQIHRATHAMLVPVQYSRIMALPDFEEFDLSSFRMKFSTSAPFAAALKAEVLRRWPGGLIEYYGMTEGGGDMHTGRARTSRQIAYGGRRRRRARTSV